MMPMNILDFTIPPLPPLSRSSLSRQSRKWTTREDNIVRALFGQKCSDQVIAAAVQRNSGAVANRRWTLKLKRPSPIRVKEKAVSDGVADSLHGEFFAMRSKEEILPDGTRRRLYGDLRGL
jgi:hypothetical protein